MDSPTHLTHRRLNWINTSVMALLHVGAVAALFKFNWRNFAVTLFLMWLASGIGICMGYHRLHTHRSYQVPLPFEYCWPCAAPGSGGWSDFLGCHASNSPPEFRPSRRSALTSRRSASGLTWAGFFSETRSISNTRLMKYAPDLAKHRFYIWLDDYHWVPWLLLGVLLSRSAGCPCAVGHLRCGSSSDCMAPGWSIPRRTCGARADSPRATIRGILVGRPDHLRRRLAQQSPRPPDLGPSWTGVVRVRPVLDSDPAAAIDRPCEIRARGEPEKCAGRPGSGVSKSAIHLFELK